MCGVACQVAGYEGEADVRAPYSRWSTFWAVMCAGMFGASAALVCVVPDTPHTHHARSIVLVLSFVFSLFGAVVFFFAALQNENEESLKSARERVERAHADLVERETRFKGMTA